MLLAVRDHMDQVVPEGVHLPRVQIGAACEGGIVERRDPLTHLSLIACPVIAQARDGAVFGDRQGLPPLLFRTTLQAEPPAQLDIEDVHERRPKVTSRDHRRQRELRIRQPRRGREDPAMRPVGEVEEGREIALSHRPILVARTIGPIETIWRPSEDTIASANITRYVRWLARERALDFDSYPDLWRWSVTDLDAFWSSIWEHFGVRSSRPYERVLASEAMPGASWFPGAELGYAEHALARRDDHPALIARSETRGLENSTTVTYGELAREVAAVRAGLA